MSAPNEIHLGPDGKVTAYVGEVATSIFTLLTLRSSLQMELSGIMLSAKVTALSIAKGYTGLTTNDRAKHIERVSVMIDQARAQCVTVRV